MPKKEICVAGQPAERKTAAAPSGAVNERFPPGLPKPRWVFFCAVADRWQLRRALAFSSRIAVRRWVSVNGGLKVLLA